MAQVAPEWIWLAGRIDTGDVRSWQTCSGLSPVGFEMGRPSALSYNRSACKGFGQWVT